MLRLPCMEDVTDAWGSVVAAPITRPHPVVGPHGIGQRSHGRPDGQEREQRGPAHAETCQDASHVEFVTHQGQGRGDARPSDDRQHQDGRCPQGLTVGQRVDPGEHQDQQPSREAPDRQRTLGHPPRQRECLTWRQGQREDVSGHRAAGHPHDTQQAGPEPQVPGGASSWSVDQELRGVSRGGSPCHRHEQRKHRCTAHSAHEGGALGVRWGVVIVRFSVGAGLATCRRIDEELLVGLVGQEGFATPHRAEQIRNEQGGNEDQGYASRRHPAAMIPHPFGRSQTQQRQAGDARGHPYPPGPPEALVMREPLGWAPSRHTTDVRRRGQEEPGKQSEQRGPDRRPAILTRPDDHVVHLAPEVTGQPHHEQRDR